MEHVHDLEHENKTLHCTVIPHTLSTQGSSQEQIMMNTCQRKQGRVTLLPRYEPCMGSSAPLPNPAELAVLRIQEMRGHPAQRVPAAGASP
jgi:hypothetical protein